MRALASGKLYLDRNAMREISFRVDPFQEKVLATYDGRVKGVSNLGMSSTFHTVS